MAYEQVLATWISFVTSAFKKKSGLPDSGFLSIMQKCKLIHFLADNYELLHYYDTAYVIDDIRRYIREQGGTIDVS